MKIEKNEIDGTIVLGVIGHIGEVESRRLEKAFVEVFESGCYQVVVDLRQVHFMTSSGLGVLLSSMKQAREQDGFMRLAGAQPLICDILHTTQLDDYFEVFPSVEDALKGDLPETPTKPE